MLDLSLREWIKYVKFHSSSPTRNSCLFVLKISISLCVPSQILTFVFFVFRKFFCFCLILFFFKLLLFFIFNLLFFSFNFFFLFSFPILTTFSKSIFKLWQNSKELEGRIFSGYLIWRMVKSPRQNQAISQSKSTIQPRNKLIFYLLRQCIRVYNSPFYKCLNLKVNFSSSKLPQFKLLSLKAF